MFAATHDQLIERISEDSNKVSQMFAKLAVRIALPDLILRLLVVRFLTWKVLRSINRVERAVCHTCDEKCEFTIKDSLQKVLNSVRSMRAAQEAAYKQRLLLWLMDDIAEKFEDKIEDYWIASDSEIKELASAVSKKMNERHGA